MNTSESISFLVDANRWDSFIERTERMKSWMVYLNLDSANVICGDVPNPEISGTGHISIRHIVGGGICVDADIYDDISGKPVSIKCFGTPTLRYRDDGSVDVSIEHLVSCSVEVTDKAVVQ